MSRLLCADGSRQRDQIALAFEPAAAIRSALLGEQHIHYFFRITVGVDRQSHESSRVRCHGCFAQLQGIHFAQALKPLHVDFAFHFFGRDAIDNAGFLIFVECVEHGVADIDPV
jgi:hypothetical protein